MSTPAPTHPAPRRPDERTIRIVSHTGLFYWWPVWAYGFLLAMWTWVESHHMAIVPPNTKVAVAEEPKKDSGGTSRGGSYTIQVDPNKVTTNSLIEAAQRTVSEPKKPAFAPFISHRTWMGTSFVLLLLLVIVITNVPLRGLWSVVVLVTAVLMVIILILAGWLDNILRALGDLHVYVNMSAYLLISLVLFGMWCLTVFLFDQRTYIIFTPGQMKVCEEIGGGEQTYDTVGMTIQKHRDDLFRHWILGLGSGDLTVRTAGAQAHTFTMPNVAFVGKKLHQIEDMQREKAV